VLGLRHPDLHWFVPIPRPKGGTVDKQVEQAADLLGEVMEERRNQPLYRKQVEQAADLLGEVMEERRNQPLYRRPDGMTSHSLASIRLLQRVVAVTPFQANCKVVIVGDAERLVVQEARAASGTGGQSGGGKRLTKGARGAAT
jgi:hypothetical protein